jgi:hypothetical protein
MHGILRIKELFSSDFHPLLIVKDVRALRYYEDF